jgi:hypothetical protein
MVLGVLEEEKNYFKNGRLVFIQLNQTSVLIKS